MPLLTDAQLRSELERCESCELKPCRDACPAHCSPADFIMAAQVGNPSDFRRAAAQIMTHNPMGASCGYTCPDTHCQAACTRMGFDRPVEIPSIQTTLVKRAAELGGMPVLEEPVAEKGKTVAVIGAGPAGLVAAHTLTRLGYRVEVFDRAEQAGGACNLIPEHRLPRDVLKVDLDYLLDSPRLKLHLGSDVGDPAELAARFDAVVLAVGLTEPIGLGVPGEEAALYGWDFLSDPGGHDLQGAVAVVGGGAVAVDVAVTARLQGAERVEIFSLEKLSEMPLTDKELKELTDHGVQVNGRVRVTGIRAEGGAISGIDVVRLSYARGDRAYAEETAEAAPFDPRGVVDVPGTEQHRGDIRHIIVAIGHRPSLRPVDGVFVAGDCEHGPSTVVEAVASGKNAALEVDAHLSSTAHPVPDNTVFRSRNTRPANKRKSAFTVPGYNARPVPLQTDFFGRTLRSPFLLSAAPPTDGYEQMKLAYEAGWAGGIMKTAFDGVPIHIPSEYMFSFGSRTWGNCDNVSGHSLDRVCGEVERLVAECPGFLVMGSTGGPVTGDHDADRAAWQSNTRKLEAAGVMGIEYSLSCPQGGDGTEGDIVAQSPAVTARIIDWILATGDPAVPKLFKLTAAVTSVAVIMRAVREVLDRYPDAKAGVTLANTFPTLGFRPSVDKLWDEGVVVGMSGEGVTPISNLTLANVAGLGVKVSGNGGPMEYKAAADFLALGAETVQFCTLAMKYGYGIIDELESGLSHLMADRGIGSVAELIGCALPEPVTDFMALPAEKKISAVHEELCVSCGNCSRCSYFAISMGHDLHPVMDAERCVGCSICTKKCISGALYMRERTPEEAAALRED